MTEHAGDLITEQADVLVIRQLHELRHNIGKIQLAKTFGIEPRGIDAVVMVLVLPFAEYVP
jgi:hypothetical protein